MAKSMEAKIPLILRFHRLMDVFTKSNDERDFYLDKIEGLSKKELIEEIEKEVHRNITSFHADVATKRIMELIWVTRYEW